MALRFHHFNLHSFYHFFHRFTLFRDSALICSTLLHGILHAPGFLLLDQNVSLRFLDIIEQLVKFLWTLFIIFQHQNDILGTFWRLMSL